MRDALLPLACLLICALHWLIELQVNAPFRAFCAALLLRIGIGHGMAAFDACRTALFGNASRRHAPWWLHAIP